VEKQQSPYAKRRRTFLILFVLSTAVFVLLVFLSLFMLTAGGAEPGDSGTDVLGIGALTATAASCLTSVATFLGFISTTILGWRKERRETRKTELESQRLEVELEKTRLELEKLKREGAAEEGAGERAT
jgi:hypothetical protein